MSEKRANNAKYVDDWSGLVESVGVLRWHRYHHGMAIMIRTMTDTATGLLNDGRKCVQ